MSSHELRTLPSRHARMTAAALLIIAAVAVFAVKAATADAPDPKLGAMTGHVTTNNDGTKTLTVQGQWQWPTHTTDCNDDKRAVGYAVDWHDGSQPGNHVTTLDGVSIDVGAASANSRNPADDDVHPTPPTKYPAAAFGGCGTYADPPGYNRGDWGPISHTYPAGTTEFRVCAVMYDVHLQSNGGTPNNTSETTAGGNNHNGDNGAEKNQSTPLGNGCFDRTVPELSTSAAGPVTAGQNITDTATLSGGNNPSGTITFTLYGPGDTTCATPVATLDATSAVSGNGSYTSKPYKATQPGTYRWIAHYSGDGTNMATEGGCNDPGESSEVQPKLIRTAQIITPNDSITVTTDASTATGQATFSLYPPSDKDCSGTPTLTQTVSVVHGKAKTTNTSITVTTPGTWRWVVAYTGDGSHAGATSPCGTERFTIVNNA